jgi:hypothetical protein
LRRRRSAPMLHMLGVDVGDDGDGRGQAVEAAVALIRLDHHPFARPGPGVRPVGMDHAAVDHGGVEAALVQQGRHHGRGRGLAMGARDGDVRLQPHQFGQHLGPAHHRQLAAARLFQFRVALLDREEITTTATSSPIFSARWPSKKVAPKLHQPVGDLAGLGVRPLHPVAQRDQHLGDARHADAADADEMDGAQLVGSLVAAGSWVCLSCQVFDHVDQGARSRRGGQWASALAPCAVRRLWDWSGWRHLFGQVGRQARIRGSGSRPRPRPARGHWPSGGRRRRRHRGSGSPAARSREISATDEAPAREMTSCASDRRRGMSVKKGSTSARMPACA